MNMIALAILSVGVLIFLVSLPLVYRKIPMNYFYGIRIPAAFESEQRWYDINAYGGRQMAAWSWLIVFTGAVGFFVPNSAAPLYLPVSTAVVLLAVLIPTIRITRWARRLPQSDTSRSNMSPVAPEKYSETPQTSSRDIFFTKKHSFPRWHWDSFARVTWFLYRTRHRCCPSGWPHILAATGSLTAGWSANPICHSSPFSAWRWPF